MDRANPVRVLSNCECRSHWPSFLIVVSVFAFVIFFLEDDTPEGTPSLFYTTRLWGFSLADVLFLTGFCFFLLYLLDRSFDKRHHQLFPMGLKGPLVLLGGAIATAFFKALRAGYPHPFESWKNLLLGVLFCWICWDAFSVRRHLRAALKIAGALIVLRAVIALVSYALGYGVTDIVTGYVPMWDGVNLYLQTAAVLMAWTLYVFRQVSGRVVLAFIPSLACVILSLRRNDWAVLAVGTVVILWHLPKPQQKQYLKKAILLTSLAGIVLVSYSTTKLFGVLGERAASMNVFSSSEGVFYATNLDHINDVFDAWGQITTHPIFGYGIGRPYDTNLISNWKEESWGVHNGPLNAWLKFGIFGLIGYLWFHFRIWMELRRSFALLPDTGRGLLLGASVFPLSLFIVSCSFVPGPYESFRGAALVFFLLAIWSHMISVARPKCKRSGP